jgi:hypothetical protein
MLRRLTLSAAVLAALMGPPRAASAHVTVNLGIDLPAPPALVPVPGTPVAYAPGVPVNYFFYGGQYYIFMNGAWCVSRGYTGPWVALTAAYVPRPLRAVPVGYYRMPPRAWTAWRREAAPRWERRWGERWAEHRGPRR